MIAAPAVDLKGGRCVQLVGGRPEDVKVSLPDPVGVARGWRDKGFRVLHVVDLDAALDRGDNLELVSAILRETPGETQVGGGVRDLDRVEDLVGAGANRVIVGTRALEDGEWRAEVANRFPGRVVVAADVRDGHVLKRGWTEATEVRLTDLLEEIRELPLAGVLYTDVGREGQVRGIDRSGVEGALSATGHPLWVSGGVTTVEELRFLRGAGAAGAVIGMALYSGALDADQVAEEFGG